MPADAGPALIYSLRQYQLPKNIKVMDANMSLPICKPKRRRLPPSFQMDEVEPLVRKSETVPHPFDLAMWAQKIPCLTRRVKEMKAINRSFHELMGSESKRAEVAARINRLISSNDCKCKLRCLETTKTA